jgi:hypothetical protein
VELSTIGEAVAITVGLLTCVAMITAGTAFIVRAVVADLRTETKLLRQALESFKECHERMERWVDEAEKRHRETHLDLYRRIEGRRVS